MLTTHLKFEGAKLSSPEVTSSLHGWGGTQGLMDVRQTLHHRDLEPDHDVVYIAVICDFPLCFYYHNVNMFSGILQTPSFILLHSHTSYVKFNSMYYNSAQLQLSRVIFKVGNPTFKDLKILIIFRFQSASHYMQCSNNESLEIFIKN